MVCDSLLTTSLFQVSGENLISTGLLRVVLASFQMTSNKIANEKLQQASKLDNLQQVYGGFGCIACFLLSNHVLL